MAKKKRSSPTKATKRANEGQKHHNPIYTNAAIIALLSIVSGSWYCIQNRAYQVIDSLILPEKATSVLYDSDGRFNEAVHAWSAQLVDRIPFDEMSTYTFIHEYLVPRIPVVIVGAYADSPLTEGVRDDLWGWEAMKERFGTVQLENRVLGGSKGCTGTGLCEGKLITLEELFDKYFKGSNHGKAAPYPHDIQLETTIPEMFDAYQKLDLFIENMLLPLKGGKDRWPSLFFGATGTQTNLHVDSMGTGSTMAVFRGRKQFLMFHPIDAPNLCMENPNRKLDYGVGEDSFKPDFKRCPSANDTTAMIADLKAGDILYMPGSTHHAARNLEDSVGISQNFLTLYDYPSILESIGGYVAKLRRKKQGQTQQAPITMDFLSTRDLYKLLAQTGYDTKWWDGGPRWYNANDATNKAYEQIMRHVELVLQATNVFKKTDEGFTGESPLNFAYRLAYFSNIRTMVAVLKKIGAWDCLEEEAKDIIQAPASDRNDKEMGDSVSTKLFDRLEKALVLTQSTLCRSILQTYLREVEEVSIPNAVRTIEEDRGLTKHCC
jgi:hypothetical protein